MYVKCVHTQTTQYLLDVALISFAHILSSVENGPRVGMNLLCQGIGTHIQDLATFVHCSFLCIDVSNNLKVEDGDISPVLLTVL